jgi:hypothetical protein
MNRQIESGIVFHKRRVTTNMSWNILGWAGLARKGGGRYFLSALCRPHSLSATFCLPAAPAHVSTSTIYLALTGYSGYKFHSKQVIPRIMEYLETVPYSDLLSQDRLNKGNHKAYWRISLWSDSSTFVFFIQILYRVIKKSLCTWWLQYRKLQVMFKVSPASLHTFGDTPNCVVEDRVQYSTVHIPNVFCDGHLQITNCVGILYCNRQVNREFLIILY